MLSINTCNNFNVSKQMINIGKNYKCYMVIVENI